MYAAATNSPIMMKKICPQGHLCCTGSDAPTPCVWGASCEEGSSSPQISQTLFWIIGIIHVVALLLHLAYSHVKRYETAAYMSIYASELQENVRIEMQGAIGKTFSANFLSSRTDSFVAFHQQALYPRTAGSRLTLIIAGSRFEADALPATPLPMQPYPAFGHPRAHGFLGY